MTALILGGYGNFGKRIAGLLTRKGVVVVIAGRDARQSRSGGQDPAAATRGVRGVRRQIGSCPTTGVAQANASSSTPAVRSRTATTALPKPALPAPSTTSTLPTAAISSPASRRSMPAAKKQNVAVISGASTVPALTCAVIENLAPRLREIDSLTFGIAPGQKAERGLATTEAILGYAGKKLKPCAGYETRYGWQDLYLQAYPEIGNRWMSNCDVPDLDLLPARFGIKRIRFSAGMEVPPVHFGMWLLSWGVRLGFPIDLPKHAAALLKASNWFDRFGSADGGMHVILARPRRIRPAGDAEMVHRRPRRRRPLYSDSSGGCSGPPDHCRDVRPHRRHAVRGNDNVARVLGRA